VAFSLAPTAQAYDGGIFSAGDDHTCGLKVDGTLACWGNNDVGEIAPPAGTFTQVSAGWGAGLSH
jgi:alpha-tubulin suppressor-like RCC1 family protein